MMHKVEGKTKNHAQHGGCFLFAKRELREHRSAIRLGDTQAFMKRRMGEDVNENLKDC